MAKFSVHYIKSNHFVDAPLDGMFTGAVAEEGKIVVCPFSERMAIPKEMIFDDSDGDILTMKDAKKIVGKNGIIRTVHGAFYLNLSGAKALVENLNETIKRLEKNDDV